MWLLIPGRRRPDAADWTGRTTLASVDALVWPAALAACVLRVPVTTGVVGACLITLLTIVAAVRLHTAVRHNERYFFTALLLAKAVLLVLAIGGLLKLIFAL